jgi:hypothetical protein
VIATPEPTTTAANLLMMMFVKIAIPGETALQEPTMTAEEVDVGAEGVGAVTTTDTADKLRRRSSLRVYSMSFLLLT